MGTWANDRRQLQTVALAGVIAVLLGVGVWLLNSSAGRPVTAYFTNTAGLYPSSEVRVRGVIVGTVDAIVPEGDQVRVDMSVTDDDVKFPADVKAAIVSPSLVTGRYVQLTDQTAPGPEWNGDPIPVQRTAVPLGVDDLTRTATELSRALGPKGANQTGALSDALNVGAQNLNGNGRALNDTIRNLGGLGATLNGSSSDLFGTITELQKFTATLRQNDPGVRELNGKLADVTGFLAGQRGELGGALNQLSYALGDVAGFVQDNRSTLKSNVNKLSSVSQEIVDHQKALAEIADVGPAALGNLTNIYNGSSETLDTRLNINELAYPPILGLCQVLSQNGKLQGLPENLNPLGQACGTLGPILNGALPLPSPQQVITQLQQTGTGPLNGPALNPVAGSPLNLTDPSSALRNPQSTTTPVPEQRTGTPGNPPAAGRTPAPSGTRTAPPSGGATPTPAPSTSAPLPTGGNDSGGLFGGLFGGGS